RREEGRLPSRAYDGDPAWLSAVARHLGDDLAGAHAERAREARRALDRGLHGLRERAYLSKSLGDLTEIEVALVDAGALDGRHDLPHHSPHGARVLGIEAAARREEDGVRAAAERLGAAHRRVDPVRAGGVVRGRHDAAPTRVSADHEGLVAELRMLQLLDGREERVEIQVSNDRRATCHD